MINFISGDKLAALIKSDKVPLRDYLVVDVRDDDWAGGNIKNSRHIPSGKFYSRVVGLIEECRNIPTIIFHFVANPTEKEDPKLLEFVSFIYDENNGSCGPKIYQDTRAELLKGEASPQEVLILGGGFARFQDKFKDDVNLVENWDPNVWAEEWGF